MSQMVSTNAAPVGGGAFQAFYPSTFQRVSFSGTSAQSSAVQSSTTLVRLVSSQDCFVAFGSSPTATSGSLFLPANTPEYFGVDPLTKIAGLQSSSAGTLYIAEGR